MKITHAELSKSAVRHIQYPKDELPEIALAGRSNVGKSSFINRLIQRKSLARTSSVPGKTQTLNFYQLNHSFYFVDVPGYGYAKVSKAERKKWGPMMEEYFESRANLKAVVLVTDIRHEPSNDDMKMYAYLKYLNHPVIVVATKTDKIKRGRKHSHLNRTIQLLDLDREDTIIPFSAVTGEGKEQVWNHIEHYLFS
ncbi:MAG TPA: ribosome biogenesis GTP-binding protein YihA/YsxC [Bacillota bacterium]|nr:ribosome biogenesis GTP-binding protein YihA/YsxC [Bacillota bacterium]